jgi:hypothetical protein
MYTVYPRQKAKFAIMYNNELSWIYKSMRVVPGTNIMLVGEADITVPSDNNGGGHDRAFAIGRFDVADIKAFIANSSNMYGSEGVSFNYTAGQRGFFLYVLSDDDFLKYRKMKYSDCINTTIAWGYATTKGEEYCAYASPTNELDYTG